MAAKGGISTEAGRGKKIDRRMSEIDKYMNDPNMELFRTASGKFQFRARKKAAAPSAVAPKRKPKTADANLVPGASGKRKTGGGSIPTPKRNAAPLSAFTGRKPRGLDTPTKVSAPKVTPRNDYSSPRAKRNMAIAETALSTAAPFGLGRAFGPAKAATKAATTPAKFSKYTKALEANRAGLITAREAMENMGLGSVSRGARNAGNAQRALRNRYVTPDEAVEMAAGYKRGGMAKRRKK